MDTHLIPRRCLLSLMGKDDDGQDDQCTVSRVGAATYEVHEAFAWRIPIWYVDTLEGNTVI